MNTKTVELPSGLKVEIKKPGILAMRQIAGQLPIVPRTTTSTEGVDMSWDDQVEMAIKLVCSCTVKPAFKEKPGDGEASIDDLDLEDFNKLAAEIIEHAGFNKSAETLGPLSKAKGS